MQSTGVNGINLMRREQVEEDLHELSVVSIEVAEVFFQFADVFRPRFAFFSQLFELA
jgi:hypothetical protein